MHEPMHRSAAVENCPGHDHAIHQLGPFDVNLLQNDTADTQAHEMRLLNAEVIRQNKDILGYNIEIVGWEFRQNILAVSVVPEVDEQQAEVRCKRINLELPRADTTACPMHKNQPRRIGILRDDLVVQQRVAVDVLLGFKSLIPCKFRRKSQSSPQPVLKSFMASGGYTSGFA